MVQPQKNMDDTNSFMVQTQKHANEEFPARLSSDDDEYLADVLPAMELTPKTMNETNSFMVQTQKHVNEEFPARLSSDDENVFGTLSPMMSEDESESDRPPVLLDIDYSSDESIVLSSKFGVGNNDGLKDYSPSNCKLPKITEAAARFAIMVADLGLSDAQANAISKLHNAYLEEPLPKHHRHLRMTIIEKTKEPGHQFQSSMILEAPPSELYNLKTNLLFSDILSEAANLLADERLKDGFMTKAHLRKNMNDKRIFAELNTGDWWHNTEKMSGFPQDAILIPLLLYTDSTWVTRSRGVTAKPIVLSLGNFSRKTLLKKEARRASSFFC